MKRIRLIILSLNLLFISSSFGKGNPDSLEYYKENFLRYDNHVYSKNIHTVIISREGNELSFPIIELGSEEKIVLRFDDFDTEVKDYYYTLIHCDANWQPSALLPEQFLNGFTEEKIIDYQFSFNTLHHFINYSITIPGTNMQPTISGNYIAAVYLQDEKNNPIITRRFMIAESRVEIVPNIHRATFVEERNSNQEVDFSILHPNYRIDNPREDIKVVIMQNDRSDNALYGLKPLFIKNNELDYDYQQGNIFNGGNEFREFDIRNMHYQTLRVSQYYYDSTGNNVILQPDIERAGLPYSVQGDLNGKFQVKNERRDNSSIEADYATVHFLLRYDNPLVNGNLYVFGQLSDWQYKDEFRLKYDYEQRAYVGKALVKQGYYNYIYTYVQDGKKKADETLIEGNNFQTENDYTILVYHKPMGSRYDHLIGCKKVNTKNIY